MSKIKKIWGLMAVGVLSTSAILGIITREGKPEITPTKPIAQEKSYIANPVAENGIKVEKLQYLYVADLLEVDENTLALAHYENLEIREFMFVGCGEIF